MQEITELKAFVQDPRSRQAKREVWRRELPGAWRKFLAGQAAPECNSDGRGSGSSPRSPRVPGIKALPDGKHHNQQHFERGCDRVC